MPGKLGMAFVKGLNMFGSRNLDERRFRQILKRIERKHSKNVKFLGIYGKHHDIVVFKKSGVHYATVGNWIEEELRRSLGLETPVTTRSMKTIIGVVDRFR